MVQVITTRELCWVRPLILAKLSLEAAIFEDFVPEKQVVDVRLTSDLIFPMNLFRAALDIEVIPILSQLEKMDLTPSKIQIAKGELQDFIKNFWTQES